MGNENYITSTPLFGVENWEYINRHNEVTSCYEIFLRCADNVNGSPIKLYSTFSEHWCKIALNKIKDYWIYYKYWLLGNKLPSMVEYCNQMYKFVDFCLSQGCVICEMIPGNKCYGEYNPEPLKLDFIRDTIFFYEKGRCVVKNNQLFLDGTLLYTASELSDLCQEIGQDFNKLDLYPDCLLTYLRTKYDNISDYTCGGYSAHNIKANV